MATLLAPLLDRPRGHHGPMEPGVELCKPVFKSLSLSATAQADASDEESVQQLDTILTRYGGRASRRNLELLQDMLARIGRGAERLAFFSPGAFREGETEDCNEGLVRTR